MRRLFLHAGQPKTGTSAIQVFLAAKRDELMHLGFHFPEAGAGYGGGHRYLIYDVIGRPLPPARQSATRAREELAASPVKDAIVSTEFLWNYSATRGIDNKVVRFFRDLGFNVQILAYVRDPVDLCDSGYSQNVKSWKRSFQIQDMYQKFIQAYSEGLNKWTRFIEESDIDIVIRPYSKAVKTGGIASDFLSTIGLSREQIDALGPEERVNEGSGPIEIAVILELMERLELRSQPMNRPQIGRLRRKVREIIRAESPEPSYRGLTTEQAQEIVSGTADARDRFARAAWGTTWDACIPSQGAERSPNRFDPRTADPRVIERYERTLASALAELQAVIQNPTFARLKPPAVVAKRGSRRRAAAG